MKHPSTNSSSYAGTVVLTLLLVFCLILFAENSFGADTEDVPQDGKIEVVYPADRLVPYRERRSDWGFTFGIQYEQIFPSSYKSQIDEFSYEEMFGTTSVDMIQGQLGVKYNFGLGSIGASAVLGAGSNYSREVMNHLDDPNTPAVEKPEADAKLQVTKIGAAITFVMDALFAEPYIAPYIEGQVFQLDWMESALGVDSVSGQTQMSTGIGAGLLIQLNWLDPAAAFEAQNTSGLQNTYLDLYVSQYNGSSSSEDPNFQTDVNYGAGLRLEF
jgi:hypothetical protein